MQEIPGQMALADQSSDKFWETESTLETDWKWNSTELKDPFEVRGSGHLGSSAGWASDSWFQLRSRFHGCEVQPHVMEPA